MPEESVMHRFDEFGEFFSALAATLKSRVLVSARRFCELETASEGVEIEVVAPIDDTARAVQAPTPALALPTIDANDR